MQLVPLWEAFLRKTESGCFTKSQTEVKDWDKGETTNRQK